MYEEVKDFESLQSTVEEYLGEFNGESKQPMHLVMFGDAIDHVSRISRVIRYTLLRTQQILPGRVAVLSVVEAISARPLKKIVDV